MGLVKNRTVLITGAAGDIGRAVSLRLVKGGAKLFLTDEDQLKLENIVSHIKDSGGAASAGSGDPKNADDVKKIVKRAVEEFGEIDILINIIDSPMGKTISNLTYDEWNESFRSNINPIFLFSKETIHKMKDKKNGRIINIGSIDYLGWRGGQSNYSAAKSAIFGFTRSLAMEVAKDQITVNSVIKGDISDSGLSEESAEQLAAGIPVKRIGRPEDMAYAVEYFASDTSKYVTGQTLFVCGGKSIHSSMSI